MALEIKVYREITAYQSKVMLGMSWRQLACAASGLVVVSSVYAACYLIGQESLGSWLTALLTMPFVAVGWIRPKGLPFERYAGYVWRFNWNPQLRVYAQDPQLSAEIASERSADVLRKQKPPKRSVIRSLELDR
jgi:hypothetical protein